MALTAVVPSVAKALLLSAAPTAEGENQQVKTGVYYIVNDKRQSGTDLCVYADTDGSLRGTMSPAPYSDLFILHSKGGEYYTIQSLKDGKYIQNVSGNYQATRQVMVLTNFRLYIRLSQPVLASLISISIITGRMVTGAGTLMDKRTLYAGIH